MTLKKFDKFDEQALRSAHEDLKNNLSMDDMGTGNLKTVVPTTDTLDKGKFRLVEESGVPVTYYRAISGTIYKQTWTAV